MLTYEKAMNYLEGKIVVKQIQIGGQLVKTEILDAKTVFSKLPMPDVRHISRYGQLTMQMGNDVNGQTFHIYTLANWTIDDITGLESNGTDLLANDVRMELFDE